jgi:hypothetical protein
MGKLSKYRGIVLALCLAVIVLEIWNLAKDSASHAFPNSVHALLLVFASATFFTLFELTRPKKANRGEVERKQQELNRIVHSGELHDYQLVSPEKFPYVDQYFYQEATDRFEENGFKLIGDVENVTLSKLAPATATFTRCLVSADQSIVGGIRHKPSANPKKISRSRELHSEFSDGTFLITNDTGVNTIVRHAPRVTSTFVKNGTRLDEMLKLHREAIAAKVLASPNPTIVRIASADDYIHMRYRMHDVLSRIEAARDFRKITPVEAAARNILDINLAIYSLEPHEHRSASVEEFPTADRGYYDNFRTVFEGYGFRFMGDTENMTLARVFPNMRTLMRRMASADGTIVADCFQARLPNRDVKTLDLETELDDGTFLVTANIETQTRETPGIEARRCAYDTPFEELLRLHKERIAKTLRMRPSLTLTQVGSLDDAIAFSRRMHKRKSLHRLSTGLFTAEDMRKQRGRELNANELAIMAELDKLKAAAGIITPATGEAVPIGNPSDWSK